MNDNSNRVTTRTLDWAQWVREKAGKDWNKPEPGYTFTGRTFDTPKQGGPYEVAEE